MQHDDSSEARARGVTGRLLEQLHQLLALLEAPTSDGASIERASAQLERLLDELQPALQGFATDAGARAELAQSVRLNAVARQLISERLAVTGSQLELVRLARRDNTAGPGQATGEWCDAAG